MNMRFAILVMGTISVLVQAAKKSESPLYPPSPEFGYGQFSRQLCGFPNEIPGLINHRPKDIHGLWHTYRQVLPGGIHMTNSRVFIYGIKSTVVPLTDIPAEYQWQVGAAYFAPDNTCHYGFWVGPVGRDGSQLFDEYLSDTGYAPSASNLVALLYDYNKFSIDYGCAKPNLRTGLCEQPVVFVNTRKRPSKMTYSEKAEVDRAINSVFTPYCISAEDIPLQTFNDAKPDCTFPSQPGCVAKKIQSLYALQEVPAKITEFSDH
ncbi:uncharacterized protein LOC129600058 [Paramacrobiotus metropolitanus]|uniref:uncharacterized protein LOC129600058 n=1 Tax=Paramacrobiotus metropolitanus TaxID=2943436 RepID=UPI002445E7A3|nr:uncharacterized protein LOC129600058 [Paramacrobiotus metropolitanus]